MITYSVKYSLDNVFKSIPDDASVAGKVPKTLKRNSNTPEEALGAVITQLRLARGWGYQHVAHVAGCSEAYMINIELGNQNPTFGLLRAIADTHGIKLSRLIAMAERRHESALKRRAAAARSAEKSK